MAALARSAWDQRGWNPDFGKRVTEADLADDLVGEGQIGGRQQRWPSPREEAVQELPRALFETASVGCPYYRVSVPPGTYRVRCFLMETDLRVAPGARRMSVTVNGASLIDKADLVEKFGHHRLVRLASPELVIGEQRTVEIFLRQVIGETFLQAVEIVGHTDAFNQFDGVPFLRRINCGGPRLAFYGGIDKHVLRRSKQEIVNELEYKIPPMAKIGGCMLALDHRIPNGSPLENYRFYLQKAWEILNRS